MARNRFTDPATGAIYDWDINHAPDGETASGKTRTIERTSNTGNVGATKQQGDDGSLVLKYSGRILTTAQYAAFWHWYALSKLQTIHFTDFAGDSYEVQITSFVPKRVGVLRNPRDPVNMPDYEVQYDIEMEVYAILAGVLHGTFVTP